MAVVNTSPWHIAMPLGGGVHLIAGAAGALALRARVRACLWRLCFAWLVGFSTGYPRGPISHLLLPSLAWSRSSQNKHQTEDAVRRQGRPAAPQRQRGAKAEPAKNKSNRGRSPKASATARTAAPARSQGGACKEQEQPRTQSEGKRDRAHRSASEEPRRSLQRTRATEDAVRRQARPRAPQRQRGAKAEPAKKKRPPKRA